uniref:Nephrocystin-3 n=1 Tax=Biomphalaria glabrata TaxID=6526 RepID=A0A2C9LVP2_BIOGL
MGTGSSFMRSHDDEDILGSDLEGTNGVLKRIPIEIKPRGKLGLRSVGSLGRSKPKGGSLRSALSMDLENPEVERIRKDFEMYRLNKDNEIANMQKKEKKLETENKRLRAELLALQKTCTRMRAERDAALEAEQEALARASVFECDRDKVQRQFKLFRETKESEIQNILRAKQELENRLSKLAYGSIAQDDTDSQTRPGIVDLGNSHPGDWWTALESEPSLGSTVQLHQASYLRGPEFASTTLEMDGPFLNVNKEDWNLTGMNGNRVFPTVPSHLMFQTLRVYVSVSPDMVSEYVRFTEDYQPKLCELCEKESKVLTIVYLAVERNLPDSTIFSMGGNDVKITCFCGRWLRGYSHFEIKQAHLDNPGSKTAIFLMSETADSKRSRTGDMGRDSDEVGNDKDNQDMLLSGDSLGGICVDVQSDSEQTDSLNTAVLSTCEMGFEKYYEHLNTQVSAAGPLPPLLVVGTPGSGKSLLMAKWLQLQEEKNSSSLLLYHFVGTPSSISADPIVMIRRHTAQLMQHMSTPPALTCDPVRLVEEFPRWLEKVSAKSPGGVILVLDSVDRFKQADVHLKWLLDPLPVDARVIVSVNEETCPQAWRSWPTLHIEPCTSKHVKELLLAELSSLNASVDPEIERKIISQCRTPSMCCPLFVSLLARHIASLGTADVDVVDKHVMTLLTCVNSFELYCTLLELCSEHMTSETKRLLCQVLQYIYASRCGMLETELLALVPLLTWHDLASLYEFLHSRLFIKNQLGLLTFGHQQVNDQHPTSIQTTTDLYPNYNLLISKLQPTYIQTTTYFYPNYNLFLSKLQPTYIQTTTYLYLNYNLLISKPQPSFIQTTTYFYPNYNLRILNSNLTELCFQCSKASASYGRVSKNEPKHNQIKNNTVLYIQHQSTSHNAVTVAMNFIFFFQSHVFQIVFHFDVSMTGRGRSSELLVYWQAVDWDKEKIAEAYFSVTKNFENEACHKNISLLRVAETYETLGRFFRDLGLLSQALPALQRALEIRETELDPDDPLVARSLHQLAVLHAQWGKYSTAETLYRHALEICQNRGQMGDPGMDNLQRRALQLEELVLGPDSVDLARSLNELGVLYYLQNNTDSAESFFKRSLEMRESLLGPDHLDVASSLNNLAALYNDSKMYDKAEPLYDRALMIRKKHQSPDSSGVASIINHLARLYKLQGKFDKAEPLYRQAIEIREKAFGPNHPSVATAQVNLAVLISQQ